MLTRRFGGSIFDAVGSDSSSSARLRFCGRDSQRRQLDFIGEEQILWAEIFVYDNDVA